MSETGSSGFEGRVVVVWRATLRCPKTFLFIEHLTVTEVSA